jgi:hypothetical protein
MGKGEYILALRISLRDVEPPVWRRILLPYDITLMRFHTILQLVMGWQDRHLFEFHIRDERYGLRDPDFQDRHNPLRSVRRALLKDAVDPRIKRFTYVYDMGDYWVHDIVVEEILSNEMGEPVLQCVAGGRQCPPEDIGGPPGYEDFLEAVSDPDHNEHDYYVDVYGDKIDPEWFDLGSINQDLELIRKKIARS